MGNDVKTRDPQADLYHKDYLGWIERVDNWCVTQIGEPDYPSHLAPNLAPLIVTFRAALMLWDDLNEDQRGKNEVFSAAATAISKKLQLLKDVIPTTIDNPPVLAEFGLDRKVPADRDELYVMAQTCVSQWIEVSGGGVPPEYAPLEADFTELLALFADFEAAKDAYYSQLNAAQQAQNAMLDARAACHELERKIFNWFRARHTDTQDEWWTGTWWGTSSGGGGGAQLPAVTGLSLDYVDPNLKISWDAVAGADGYKLMMGNNPTILTTTLYVGPDTSYTFDPPGGHHYFRVWAMKGDVLGARGDYVEIEIAGIPPAVPKNLKATREGVYIKWEWKSGGDVPDYFRLYIATVPTGSPPPSRPAKPEHDELITLFVSTFAPGPGNTVYGWVTAFGDGAESEAEGPASIEIM